MFVSKFFHIEEAEGNIKGGKVEPAHSNDITKLV